jgi:CMP-N,N'-diacetyllegionaminic acid synthase
MDVLALVPARGGSKGLPRKNVRLLAGKPLIVHTLEHALASRAVTRTIVSTDDDEITRIAVEAGAEVPFRRPAELAGDLSTDLEVFQHALQWLESHEGYAPDLVVHLRPTHPVRDPRTIDAAVRLIQADEDADSLRSVSTPRESPFKMWRVAGHYLEPLVDVDSVPEAHSSPRQSLPEVWWQNGYVDVVRPRTVLNLGSMAGTRVLPFVIDEPGVDIDYEESFLAAEELLTRTRPEHEQRERRHPS